MDSTPTASNSSQDRLVTATQRQWQAHGSAGISARQISASAGIPASSIYHHFGSLEHLLACAQADARTRARAWCDALLAELGDYPATPQALAGFFAQVIDEWCESQRELAFAWREGGLLAQSSEALRAEARNWQALWHDFWTRACTHFAIAPEYHLVVERIFESESLFHMIRWRRTVDRPGLGEVAQVLGAWLTRSPPGATPWRDHAQRIAQETMPVLPTRDEAGQHLVATAARLLGEVGSAHLTHRLVAQHAGVTLGTVSHKFKTKSDLLEAAFEETYSRTIARLGTVSGHSFPRDSGTLANALSHAIVRASGERARDELFLAVARDPALARFGRQLRYLRGRTGYGLLRSLVGTRREVSPLEGALFSAFTMAQIHTLTHELADSAAPASEAHLEAYRESVIQPRIEAEIASLVELIASC